MRWFWATLQCCPRYPPGNGDSQRWGYSGRNWFVRTKTSRLGGWGLRGRGTSVTGWGPREAGELWGTQVTCSVAGQRWVTYPGWGGPAPSSMTLCSPCTLLQSQGQSSPLMSVLNSQPRGRMNFFILALLFDQQWLMWLLMWYKIMMPRSRRTLIVQSRSKPTVKTRLML